MKNILLSMLLLLMSGVVSADAVLGVRASANLWLPSTTGGYGSERAFPNFTFDDKSTPSYALAFEHFIPLLPNLRWQQDSFQTEGLVVLDEPFSFAGNRFAAGTSLETQLELKQQDIILYYELFDNDLFQFDFGLVAKQVKGDVIISTDTRSVSQPLSQWLPLLYLDTQIALPALPFGVFAQLQGVKWQDSQIFEGQIGIIFPLFETLLLDGYLQSGFRVKELKLDNVDNLYSQIKVSGLFAGITLHF